MFRNFVKIAWRNLLKSKVFSFINIAGLGTGMAVALLIGLWIWDQVSFNSYFPNHKRIAQVRNLQTLNGETGSGDANAIPVGQALRNQFASDIKRVAYVSWNNDHQVKLDDKLISSPGVWTQPDFTSMFSLEMVEGNRDVLNDPSTMCCTSGKLLYEGLVEQLSLPDNNLVVGLCYCRNWCYFDHAYYSQFPGH